MYRTIVPLCILLFAVGCNATGFSLSPPRNLLTEQAQAVINRTPMGVDLPRELNETVLAAHYIQPGDVLIVEPVALDSAIRFPADQRVLADGTVDLGGYGRVIVAGLTLEAAEELIETAIENRDEEATQINVRLLEQVHRFYVLGEVASPGSYPFVGNEKVLDAILAAGGLTSQADACKIVLARPTPPPSCRVALPICYREITQLGDTTTNYQIQPGDRIFVASRRFCDDLKFWKSNETCDRCCGCQYPCPDPATANYRNPISSILPAPPVLPPVSQDETLPERARGQVSDPGLLEEPSGTGLPRPALRRLSPPAAPTSPEGRPRGQLEFDEPLPSLDYDR